MGCLMKAMKCPMEKPTAGQLPPPAAPPTQQQPPRDRHQRTSALPVEQFFTPGLYCFGLAEVRLSDGRDFVGDLYRGHHGGLELVVWGEEPLVLCWVDVDRIRMLSEAERQELNRMAWRGWVRKRRPVARPSSTSEPGEPLGGLLLT